MDIVREDSSVDDCELNVSLNSEEDALTEHSEHMSPLIPAITAVYSIVFVVGLLGNCLVMYVIIRYGISFRNVLHGALRSTK